MSSTTSIPDASRPAQTAVTADPRTPTLWRMTEYGSIASECPDVTIRCRDDPSTRVRFFDRYFRGEYETGFAVEVHADGLQARLDSVETSVWDHEYLTDFLDRLVADFRGWDGERTWSTNDFYLRAVFRSGGHIGLTWTLRPWTTRSDSWEASVTTWVEGGERMAGLAADVRQFLDRGSSAPTH